MSNRALVGPSNGIANINVNCGRLEPGEELGDAKPGEADRDIDHHNVNSLGLGSNRKRGDENRANNGKGGETHVDRI